MIEPLIIKVLLSYGLPGAVIAALAFMIFMLVREHRRTQDRKDQMLMMLTRDFRQHNDKIADKMTGAIKDSIEKQERAIQSLEGVIRDQFRPRG